MSTLTDLHGQLSAFQKLLSGGAGTAIAQSEAYDLMREDAGTVIRPHAKEAGVNVLFSEDQQIVYIGRASCGASMGRRIFSHVGGGALEMRARDGLEGVRYLRTIRFNKPLAFFAPALEKFLIERLNPPANKLGRRREDQ